MDVLDAGLPAGVRGLFTTRSGDGRPAVTDHVVRAEQVHGAAVAVVDRRATVVPGVDALVTRTPGVVLATRAADCMPVLFADVEAHLVAAAHAGRPGLMAGILQATVATLVEQGGRADRIVAVVGPCIGGCCYELPPELVRDLDSRLPGLAATTTWATPSIDLRTGADLVLAGVGVHDVRHVGGCTYEQPDRFFSYRRDATTERHRGQVALA